jgi:2-succinyl-5-enolpyruvyl-6-hydroxy-3-cyclohexene-1-carboxylate synthase
MAAFAKLGVTEFFLSPGARSQALAIAAGQLAQSAKIKLHVRLDERSSAFQALGAALGSGEPAVVITTSGTAVANLHPAVLEAHHSGVPLILLTADRPHELRGVGANQTTNQVGIFSDAVRKCFDVAAPVGDEGEAEAAARLAAEAVSLALGFTGQPGPVQLNLAFREPLSATEPNAAELTPLVSLPPRENHEPRFIQLKAEVPTVVLAGAQATDAAVELAESFGWPLFAEPSSGARMGANVIERYRILLDGGHELAGQIGRVIVFGKPTLSRSVIKLLFNEAVEVVVVESRTMGFFDVSRRAVAVVDEVFVDDEVDFAWLENWRQANAEFSSLLNRSDAISRRQLIEAIWSATGSSDRILLGASRLIREAEIHAPAKPVAVFANRGLAGIDGTIATGIGLSMVNEGVTRVLLGDLTFLHDANSLAGVDKNLQLQLIIGNDNGGTIFSSLEMAKQLPEAQFELLFKTPQQVDLWHLAQAYGLNYVRVETLAELQSAMDGTGPVVIDVRL